MRNFTFLKLLTIFLLCVFILPAQKVYAATNVRVLIAEDSAPVSVKTSGAIFVKDLANNKKYSVKKAGTFKVSTTAKQVQAGSVKSTKGVQISLKNKKTIAQF